MDPPQPSLKGRGCYSYLVKVETLQYLSFPHKVLDDLETLICTDLERAFAESVEARLQFMRMRGVEDAYELAQVKADFIREKLPNQQALLDKYLEVIPPYLDQKEATVDEFEQCWALMGTIWNVVEFDRIRPVVRLQEQYPVLLDVARRVGRIADDQGPERVPVSVGGKMSVEHGAPSDIEGVTMGNDITALLPMEMAIMSDDQLSNLFAYRFATRRLQTFRYKSNMMKQARRVEVRKARQKGPMIVCLDTSGSMQGQPEKIASSLIIKLLQVALRQERDLLLVAFSTTAKLFDVRRNRTRFFDFLRKECGGDTDGTQMLQAVMHTIAENPAYGSADVLLISDFKFDVPGVGIMRQVNTLRDEGTRFYGLQIGVAPIDNWKKYLDNYWHLEYKLQMRPWFIQK